MHKTGDGVGILAREFLAFVDGHLGDLGPDPITATPAQMIELLRRAFYAGANIVIGAIDDAPDDARAAEAIMMMKVELVIVAHEVLLADLAANGGS